MSSLACSHGANLWMCRLVHQSSSLDRGTVLTSCTASVLERWEAKTDRVVLFRSCQVACQLSDFVEGSLSSKETARQCQHK
jgi:hypothetical protein